MLCNIRNFYVKMKNGVMVYLLFLFSLTKMHVPALCKQIVSDAATNGLLPHFGALAPSFSSFVRIICLIIFSRVDLGVVLNIA